MPSVVRRGTPPTKTAPATKVAPPPDGDAEYEPNFPADEPAAGPGPARRIGGPKPANADVAEDEDIMAMVRSGWAGHEEMRKESSAFTQNLKLTEEPVLVKILDDEPAVAFLQHWIERPGKRSWVCRKKTERGCPLCDIGDKPKEQLLFNVVVMGPVPEIKPWVLGVKGGEFLKKKANDPRKGPLTRHYWELSMSGGGKRGGGTVNYDFDTVHAEDLVENWGVQPLSADKLEKFQAKRFGVESIGMTSYESLEEIVAEVTQYG